MNSKPIQWLINFYHRLRQPINLTSILKSIYSKLAPVGSKRYRLTHVVLRGFLKHFRLLNIRYQYWIRHFDTYDKDTLNQFQEELDRMVFKPRFSVIMPVYNPQIKHLQQAIESVVAQVYPNWELCIADDASTKAGIHKTLQEFQNQDDRIRVIFRKENGHISAASNSALELATGEFIVLLDHDDLLHPLALYFLAQEIQSHPKCEILYSDEDKLTAGTKRVEPYFKSDFDYELLLSQNMVSHLGAYRTSTVRKIGGFRVGLEGSQDYDLLLRVIEQIEFDQICHIPKVLYHWRISKQSVATSVDIKPYAIQAAQRAISDHLKNRGILAKVEPLQKFGYHVKYQLSAPPPSVELYILPSQSITDLRSRISTLLEHANCDNFQLNLVISESSKDEDTSEEAEGILSPHLNLVYEKKPLTIENLIKNSKATFIGIINENILKLPPNWLADLLSVSEQTGIGAVSPKLCYKNGYIYSCGVILGAGGIAKHLFNGISTAAPDYYFGWASLTKGYSALPSECLIFRRALYENLGGFDDSISDHQAKIIDFCLKLKKMGLRNVVVPTVQATLNIKKGNRNDHAHRDLIQNESDRSHFIKFWGAFLKHDPAFNPNLELYKARPMVSKHPSEHH